MYRKQVNAQSPLRILERSIHGGLGAGNLGVVMAPAGVGKTACLVQIGLDDLMRDRDVLHVSIGQTVEHVSAWYDALFDDLARLTALDERDSVGATIARHRVIKTFESTLQMDKLQDAVKMFAEHLKLAPKVILVDGFTWKSPDCSETLGRLKAMAKEMGAELWMSAQTPRGYDPKEPRQIGPPCDACRALIDVGIFLQPQGDHVTVRLVKDHDSAELPETHLELHCDTLRLVAEGGEARAAVRTPVSGYTLLSGGAEGAEAEFGACAERFGLHEAHYTFSGRKCERARGVVELSAQELKQGEVSAAYLKAHMHRSYPQTPLFQKVLQSIWHQVSTAGEVFAVGAINADGTVTGGTGWAVELAKHWAKPVFVFDQEKSVWFHWSGGKWESIAPPKITRTRFTGTGTRHLNDAGRAAILSLFERSFANP